MIDVLTAILWIAGSAFALLAALGVLRMPDVFTRMQASTKASTLGLGCLLIGAALQLGDFGSVIRVVSIGAFVLLTTPVAGHVIARAAYLAECPALGRYRPRRAPGNGAGLSRGRRPGRIIGTVRRYSS